jgi:hypothetical protein
LYNSHARDEEDMSRTATLQPLARLASFSTASTPLKELPFQHQPTYITLTRMVVRFSHNILLLPPSESLTPYQEQVQRDLHSPLPYHRTKWLHNIEHARTLLLQLEQSAKSIKVQRVKRDVVHDLAEKRTTIKKLRARIEEIGREVEAQGTEAHRNFDDEPGETVEQFLGLPPLKGQNTRTNGINGNKDLEEGRSVSLEDEEPKSKDQDNAATILDGKPYSPNPKDDLFNVRRRRGKDQPAETTTSGFSSLPTTEKALLADSATHENITTSLVQLATELKQRTRNFQASLESDKGLVDRVLEGLDKNVTGMEAASKRIGVLRRMSEGKGWWGRIMLYAWIFGLWIVAILLVFVGPKLRF